jgi:hypothetical protein
MTEAQNDGLAQLIESVIRECAPKTVRLRVSVDQPRRAVRALNSVPYTIEQAYLQGAKGERYYDERAIASGKATMHNASFCDGAKCANIVFNRQNLEKQFAIGVDHTFMDEARTGWISAPLPFRYYYVGFTRLAEALPKAKPRGDAVVMNRPCEVYLFRDEPTSAFKDRVHMYFLDRDTGVPLKVANYINSELLDVGKPSGVWEATSLETVQGRHFPRTSTFEEYVVQKADDGRWKHELDMRQTIRVTELEFDAPIPAESFWPTFQPGVLVLDTVAGKNYTIPGGDSALSKSAAVQAPVRVSSDAGSPWLAGAGILLSLSLLVTAFFLWRRSR